MSFNPNYNNNLLIFSRENTSWGPYGGRGGSKYAVCTGYNILIDTHKKLFFTKSVTLLG